MFIETRGNDGVKPKKVVFSYAILNPSASYGGLFVPESLPELDDDFFKNSVTKSYKEITKEILLKFKIDINEKVIDEALNLYDKFDDKKNPIPLKQIEDNLYINELFHGPTRAFKDIALQPFGHILSHLAKKMNEHYLILVATSGDTGPATLNTFSNKENIKVVCLYPDGGTSDVQRLQMLTQNAKNLKIVGIKGSFDDAQNALKSLLSSKSFNDELDKESIKLSVANSVNFGRIIFQIIYHIFGYINLLKQQKINQGDFFSEIIPSGNFGNALGAYYAKKMGLPVKKILISSNINNILSDFINTGIYDLRDRKLLKTTSPAMDILISSNVERILSHKFGAKRCKELMDSLQKNRYYKLSDTELLSLREDFDAVYCDDSYAKESIKKYSNKNYILDPHTATTIKAYENLSDKDTPTIACSTAEWTKFAPTMLNALKCDDKIYSDFDALSEFSKLMKLEIPKSASDLFEKKIIHKKIVAKDEIENEILTFIKG